MTIHHLPSFLKPFFRSLCLELTRPQYAHLWSLVMALALNLRASKLVHLSRMLPASTHRTRHGAFLASDGFEASALLNRAVDRLMRRLKPRPGEIIELILDDHRIAKRGKKMDRISKIWDQKDQRFVHGHIILFAAVCLRGVVIRMVISKRPHETWKTTVAIVTNCLGMDARAIVAAYERRWNIEVMFKDLEQSRGLGNYQMLHERAIVNHLHLVCLAHLMLTHLSSNKEVRLPTVEQRIESLRRAHRDEQIRRLFKKGTNHARYRKKLNIILQAA